MLLDLLNDCRGRGATVEGWRQSRCIRAAEMPEHYSELIADYDCVGVVRIAGLAVQAECLAFPDGRNSTV